MDKLFINYSGNIESFKRLGLEETYKKRIVFIEKDGAIYTHNAYYAGPDVIKSIQEALSELQEEVKEGDYVASIRQVDGKIETTMGTFEERDSKILEDSKSYTDELKKAVTTAIATEYMRATGAEKNLSERIDSHLDITERALSEKADKDSVYDKDQIDLKLTGVYKIKGSCTFEKLPKTNKVGDVYNITNSFTLDEEEYTAGTNVVYTENGWDILAGIFDTSAIELDIQRVSNLLALEVVRAIKAENDLEDKINEGVIRALEKELELDKKFDNYLPLSGGIIVNTSNSPLKVATTSGGWSGLQCINKNGTLGHIGVWLNGDPVYVPSDLSKGYTMLHEGNYSDYALPLKGGTINGELKINGNSSKLLEVDRINDLPLIKFSNNGVVCGYIGSLMDTPVFKDRSLLNTYKIYHEGNFNPSDYLPLSGGKISGALYTDYIYSFNSAGMLSMHPSDWLGVASDQWGVGHYGSEGVIRGKNNLLHFDGAHIYKVWTEGNDGPNSGLDADTLDGVHLNSLFKLNLWFGGDVNTCTFGSHLMGGNVNNSPISSGTLLSFNTVDNKGGQLIFGSDFRFYFRSIWDKFGSWKTVAFTDSDITGNAASASYVKLLDEITTDSFFNYIGDYAKGITAFSNKTDQTIGNIGLYDTVLNVGSTGDRFFRLLSKKNGDLRYQTPVNNANAWGPERTIIDSENVAQYTKHFYDLYGGVEIPANADLNDYKTVGTYCIKYDVNAASVANLPIAGAGTIKVFMSNGGTEYVIQEYVPYTGNVTYRRRYQTNDKQWRRWVLISTDLDNYNAPTATKLATPVKLWGLSFDGSSSIMNNDLILFQNPQGAESGWALKISFKNSSGDVVTCFGAHGGLDRAYYAFIGGSWDNPKMVVTDIGSVGIGTTTPQYKLDVNGIIANKGAFYCYLDDNNIRLTFNIRNNIGRIYTLTSDGSLYSKMYIGKNTTDTIVIDDNLVGIGTGNPQHKLDVNGRIKSNNILINNYEGFSALTNDGSQSYRLMFLSNNNTLIIGRDNANGSKNSHLEGYNVLVRTGSSPITRILVNPTGNVTIGSSDLAGIDYKLYVDGTIKSTDKIFINDDEVITEAPSDTTMYARSNKSWVPISGYEDIVSYGVKWEKNATSPICTRIGNPLLHKELPIQSQFRGCVYDYKTGVFKYWLNPNDWSLKEDGTASVLDGTDGDICVHTPKFYGKSGKDNGYYWVRISLTKIDDSWIEIPEMYIGAYRSTVDRTNNLARSIVNTSTLYRGGTNSTDYDQYLETDPFRTLLGKPATNISRANMRTYCRNNNSEMLSYEQYKWIFYWAYIIEYANFNALAGYNEELTTEGYRQGGLGNGMTTWSDSNWNLYNYYNPITPCGYGNNIGNFTGIKTITVPAYTGRDGTTSVTEKSYLMPRWRGFDNPFGDIWTNLDGVIILGYVDLDGNPSYKEVYTTTDPTKYGDTLENMLDMNIAGIEIYKAGYTLEFDLRETAEIIPSAVGASTTTGKCDYHYVLDSSTNYTNLRTLLVGGGAYYGGDAGPGYFYSHYGVGAAGHNVGFRMVKEIKD